MKPDHLRAEAKRLRSTEPPKAIRGFDEGETRKVLEDAGRLLEAAALEHEEMQRELEQLRSQAGEETAGKEAIGKALLTATHAAEEITADARAAAERITAEAEARAATILEQAATVVARENETTRSELERERAHLEREQEGWRQVLEGERRRVLEEARAQADSIVADARGEAERLQSHGEQLRSLLADSRQRFVALAESALRQLEDVDRTRRGPDEREVLDDLRPATSARD